MRRSSALQRWTWHWRSCVSTSDTTVQQWPLTRKSSASVPSHSKPAEACSHLPWKHRKFSRTSVPPCNRPSLIGWCQLKRNVYFCILLAMYFCCCCLGWVHASKCWGSTQRKTTQAQCSCTSSLTARCRPTVNLDLTNIVMLASRDTDVLYCSQHCETLTWF